VRRQQRSYGVVPRGPGSGGVSPACGSRCGASTRQQLHGGARLLPWLRLVSVASFIALFLKTAISYEMKIKLR
jgi:uncharacterized membrane protein